MPLACWSLFQFILGGIISPLVGLNGEHDMTPYLLIISVTAILLVLLQFIYFKLYSKTLYLIKSKASLQNVEVRFH